MERTDGEFIYTQKLRLSAEFSPCFLPACLALLLGAVWFTVIRDPAVGYITSLGDSIGIEPSLLPMLVCMVLLGAIYFGVMSAVAVIILPCFCIAGGFTVEAVSYIYNGKSHSFPDFLFFYLLVFAFIFSVLFVSSYAMKLSKSIQSCISSNRKLKSELVRYQVIFVLVVMLLLVSGYFVLT